jgi:hypothetical protein
MNPEERSRKVTRASVVRVREVSWTLLFRRGHPLIGSQSLTGLLLHPQSSWLAARLFPALLNPSFFHLLVIPSVQAWVLEEAAKGSCVSVDLQLIKIISSWSSVGRPSISLRDHFSWKTSAPHSFRIHCHCKKKKQKTIVYFQGAKERWSRDVEVTQETLKGQKAIIVQITTSKTKVRLNFIFSP